MFRLLRKLLALVQRRRQDAELAEELDLHRSLAEHRLEATGLNPDAAARAARRSIGNVTLAREDARALWIWPWIESVWQDLLYAFRSLRREPGFALTALLTLGVGIGLNTSLATLCGAMLWQPWRVGPAAEIAEVIGRRPNGSTLEFNLDDFQLLSERTSSGVALATGCGVDGRQESCRVHLDGDPVVGHFVSGNYFNVLEIPMARGRGFTTSEDGVGSPVAVAVISHGLWQRRFGRRADILTTPIDLDGTRFNIVGVTAESFSGTTLLRRDVWVPLAAARLLRPSGRPGLYGLDVAIRLRTGVSHEKAGAEIEALLATRPPEPRRVELAATSSFGRPSDRRESVAFFTIAFTALLLVLLIACANAGNLLLARTVARAREMAVRASIGASRARLVRQLLTESFMLACGAALIGVWLARIVPTFVIDRGFQSSDLGGRLAYSLAPDWRALAFAVGLVVFTCLAFGLAPALHASRGDLTGALKDRTGRNHPRLLRNWLLGAQVAIGVVLLASAGLLVRGLQHARVGNFGFDVNGVTLTTFELPASYDPARKQAFALALLERASLFSARTTALTSVAPLEDGVAAFARRPGAPDDQVRRVSAIEVTPGYFDVLGLALVAGRALGPGDAGGHAIVVNQTMASRMWPGTPANGQTILVESNDKEVPHEIVGVVKDADTFGNVLTGGTIGSILYEHLAAASERSAGVPTDRIRLPSLLTRESAAATARGLIELGTRLEPRVRVAERPLTVVLDRRLTEARLMTWLGGGVGLVALVLAMIGVFGVFAYLVRQQSRDIGVRIALGARSSQVVRSVIALGVRPLLIGAVTGLTLAVAVGYLLRASLYGLSPLDPLAYGGVLVLLGMAAVLSLALPAWRATRVDPADALRAE